MPKITLQVPKEITDIIKESGYDLESYLHLVFLKPLLEMIEQKEKATYLSQFSEEIAAKMKKLQKRFVIEKENQESASPQNV